MTAWAVAAGDDFEIESGAPTRYESRNFCSTCGSSLFRETDDAVFVHTATLDDPNAVEPRVHQCVDTQIAWLRVRDLLPFVEGAEHPPASERRDLRGPANPAVTRDSTVSLRAITKDNLRDVLFADVAGNQRRFVAPNDRSLAQAHFHPAPWYRAIYADDTVVGFVMAEVMTEDDLGLPLEGDPYLWRFMIDDRYQGLGFGGRALELVIAELFSWDGTRDVWVSCVRGTGSPYGLYVRYGFEDTGVADDGEIILRLRRR